MQSFEISHRKEFMAKLLKSDLFDGFEVKEIIAHVAFKMVLDGKRNLDYFSDINEDQQDYSQYLTWGEMRKHVYELMHGSKLPTYFKIVFSTSIDKTISLSSDVSTFYLNITFKDNKTICSTGVAYKGFILDKSADYLWDEKIKQFLFKYEFI